MDCTFSTGGYEPFESIGKKSKSKRFFCYYADTPVSFSDRRTRRSDKVLTNGKSITSVYAPNLETPLLAYGDTKGTCDALLMSFSEDFNTLEIWVARGQASNKQQLFNLFADGELDGELAKLRKMAYPID